ncbi:MAG: proline hydroxylase [Acidobacteria bacterium]|nr:MAG: proline hydroxylase [Acidobacteriota bacterium]PYR49344.1 MAG: proline hydroxylase [Acidobacteriota bacterium]
MASTNLLALPTLPTVFAPRDRRVTDLRADYCAAQPFPHIVLDNFLDRGLLEAALREFPDLASEEWIHYTHVNERKFGLSNRAHFGPALGTLIDTLNGPRFVQWLEQLTSIQGLKGDETLEGGGLHQSARGGFLNVHADFTVHPHRRDWRRRVNLLVYLNHDWQDEYGGHLELWDRQVRKCVRKVAPIFDRAVVFSTDPDSFHGHPEPLACPPEMTRKSLALYYFTEETTQISMRSTEYRARPGDGWKRLPMRLDNLALRMYDRVKRTLGLDDRFASRMLARIERLFRSGNRVP